MMVDFETKWAETPLDDDDLSGGEWDEPLMEVTDEFGRTRMVKQSRVRRQLPSEQLKPYVL
jgi:hypothetical protein